MKSTEQMLRNPDIAPSSDVIAKALGEANDAYIKFINELAKRYSVRMALLQRRQGVAGKRTL